MLDPVTLLSPRGPVRPEMFPETPSNILASEVLQGFLDRAYDDSRLMDEDSSKHDDLARNLSLSYIFQDVFVRLSSQPKSLTVSEKGSHNYDMAQINNFRALSEQYLGLFLAGLSPKAGTLNRRRNATLRNKYTW